MSMDWDDDGKGKGEAKNARNTDVDLEKYIIDENLNNHDRARLLLKQGVPVQRAAVLRGLHRLIAEEMSTTADHSEVTIRLGVLFEAAKAQLAKAKVDFEILQGAASGSTNLLEFSRGLEDDDAKIMLVHVQNFILSLLSFERAESIVVSAMGTLEELISVKNAEDVRTTILPFAMARISMHMSADSRAIGCRVLGLLCRKRLLAVAELESTFFAPCMQLCQDTSDKVRATMCLQLDPIARSVSERPELIENSILPELLELLEDEQVSVRQAALEGAVEMIDTMPLHVVETKMLPFFRSACSNFGKGV